MRLEVLAGQRRATYIGLPLLIAFGVLDLLSVHDSRLVTLFLGLRLALVPVLLLLLWIANRRPALTEPAALFGTYLVGAAIAAMSALYGGHQSFYYAGINLVILAIGVLIPFRPLQILGCAAAVTGTYVALTLAFDPVPFTAWRWGIFLSNLVFLGATAAVVAIGAYVQRQLRREAYHATWEQEAVNHRLRLANQETQRSFAELADKQRELEEAYRYKSQFLDNMSHELRTPLTCILTPLEGILAGDVRGEAREVLEDMHRATRQLYDLIDDLLDYSRYGAREVPLRRAPVDLLRLIDDNVRAWTPTARQRGVELRWQPPATPLVASLDGREIAKVIRNLISNAVKFTPSEGTVEVMVMVEVVEGGAGGAEGGGEELILEVRDSGIGIDEAAQRQLFRPFFQVDGTATRSVAGTGLGLALVKTIVERHGGAIAVDSALGRGTAMRVRLPRIPVHDTEAASTGPEVAGPAAINLGDAALGELLAGGPGLVQGEASTESTESTESIESTEPVAEPVAQGRVIVLGERRPPEPRELPLPLATPLLGEHLAASEGRRGRILVVDDQPELLRMIVRILGREHDLITANDGEEGLRRAEETDGLDLVISDVMMPRMSGFDLVAALRAAERTARLPVLLLTARADGVDRVRGLRRGANDYLVKPFLPDELRARVRNLLGFRRYEGYLTRLNQELDSRSSELEGRLHGLFLDTVRTLVAAIDAKDYYTGGHSERVSFFAVRMGEHLRLPRPLLRTIELGALLHDIGKIGIPDRVLNKPGRLSAEEIEVIREHTVFGGKILEKSPELAELRRFALHHHERWDGRGYPDGLRGDEIPRSVRVVSVADCWDAMVSDRVYRPGMPPEVAASKIQHLGGSQFDPELVEALMEVWRDLEVPPHLRPLRPLAAPTEVREGPRVSECGEVYHLHE